MWPTKKLKGPDKLLSHCVAEWGAGVSYAGMKGFSERIYGVTNSPKTRNYYPAVRYLKDDALLEVILTGKIPSNA